MFDSNVHGVIADYEVRYVQTVVLPAAERRANLEHELALLKLEREPASRRPAPLRWLGARLIRLGENLTAEAPPRSPPGSYSTTG